MSPSRSPSKALFVEEVIARWRKLAPNPKCELFYKTPYQLLVSVVLSAQATDKSVNRCMQPLYEAGLTPETILAWGQEGFLARIKTIGLANTKARNVLNLTKILVEKHRGQVPKTREELEELPGVGRKTANVVLGEIFKEPTLAVDTHAFRVGARLGFHQEKTAEKAELAMLKIIDRKHLPKAHHWLILHGRYTCKAIKPLCEACVLNDLCPYFKNESKKKSKAQKKPKVP